MKNILLVLKREYISRVKKKSFIVLTLLSPLLFAMVAIVPTWLATKGGSVKTVKIIDQSGLLTGKFKNSDKLIFDEKPIDLAEAKTKVASESIHALVVIPQNVASKPDAVTIYSKSNVSFDLKTKIEKTIEEQLSEIKLLEAGLSQKVLQNIKVRVNASTKSISDEGEKDSSSGAATAIGYFTALVIYMAIFIYGAQVMRGVMEEKQSRIVEVIVSSVKPFQLMMGKILGIALVGFTQFFLWIVLTFAITSASSALLSKNLLKERMKQNTSIQSKEAEELQKEIMAKVESENVVSKSLNAVNTLNIPLIIFCFICYFIGGYLLYSSYFAAIGSAVDSDTEVQQFMLPVTIPLVISIALAQFVLMDPSGPVAFWGSIIPLTSPILMMVRLPFGVPMWEIALSIGLLVVSFIGMVLFAAKIYRVGILMYGKKASYKEIKKWLFFKN